MNAQRFLTAFAEAAGVDPPSAADVETLLDVAGVAAHGSERIAAPITCWLVAKAGMDPAAALALARQIAESSGE